MKLEGENEMDKFIFPIMGEENKLPFYITGVGGHANQQHIVRENGYNYYQFLYCVKGSGILILDGKKYNISENTGFVLYTGEAHEYYGVNKPWETHWITFDGTLVQSLLSTLGFNKSEHFYIYDTFLLDNILNQMYIIAQSSNIEKGFTCSGLLYNFILEMRKCISKEKLNSKPTQLEQLQLILSYIEKNFAKLPSIEEMSDTIKVSPQYLCRLFKNSLNMRPFVYVTKRRIQEAKRMLIEENIPIKDIAKEIGYNDTSYFCAMFKKYENISPQAFRNMHKRD